MNKSYRNFFYEIFQLFFQWSLVYLLVLFFLEDLKPYLVSSKFYPHWFMITLLISAIGLLYFARYQSQTISKSKSQLNKFDKWLILILSIIVALFWFSYWYDFIGWWAIIFSVPVYFIIKKTTNLFIRD